MHILGNLFPLRASSLWVKLEPQIIIQLELIEFFFFPQVLDLYAYWSSSCTHFKEFVFSYWELSKGETVDSNGKSSRVKLISKVCLSC